MQREFDKPCAIGIDFGTSKSCVAVLKNGAPVVITDFKGHRTSPSVVLVDPDDKLHIGWEAVNNPLRYRSRSFTISSVKRLMGTIEQVQWGTLKTYPQEISSLIIALLKAHADAHCGHDIQTAVIAVPAHYNLHQRWATLQAAEIAGFANVRLINEATAAVLAYKVNNETEESILVFDFGAGTLDVSVVEWGQGVAQVKSSAGDDRLGGDDFDQIIVRFALDDIERKIGKVELDSFQKMVLCEAARQAKEELTSSLETTLFRPGFVQTAGGPIDLNLRLDRGVFKTACKPLLERAKQVLNLALLDSQLSNARPSKLLLIGGTSRIPCVREMVRQVVGLEAITGLDPESGVCEGACILSGTLNGSIRNLVLLDVTPTSYSVGLKDDSASVLIPRNATIPTRKTAAFTTTEDNQTELTVRVFQGERQKTSQNSFVGEVRLTGLPLAKAGVPAIEVCFDIDVHGTLRASATDGATKKNVTAVLESPYRLNPGQLKVLQRKVQKEIGTLRNAEVNRRKLEAEGEARGQALRLAEHIGDLLQEFEGQVPTPSRVLLNSGIAVIREYLAANASAADLSVLAASLRSTFEDAVLNLVVRELESITQSRSCAEWQRSASNKRTKTDCISSIAELKAILQVNLDRLASLLRRPDPRTFWQRLPTDPTAGLQPVSIFVLTQFFGFRPTAAQLRTMRKSNRELLRILALATIAGGSRSNFASSTGQVLREEFDGTDCFFLLEYLSPEMEPHLRSTVEDCLAHMPIGTWRSAWRACHYQPEFVQKNPIAGQGISREIGEILRGPANPTLQLDAVDDLERLGVERCGPVIAEMVIGAVDSKVKSRLLSLLGDWKQPQTIILLFQAIANEHGEVSAVAMKALRKRESELAGDLSQLLRLAERILPSGNGPTLKERFLLWWLGRKNPSLRNLIRFLISGKPTQTTGSD